MANETMQWPNPGLGSVGSYQMSAIPYASASITVPVNSSATASTMTTQIINNATSGDYYSVQVYQNSGGALNHANNEANFIVQKI